MFEAARLREFKHVPAAEWQVEDSAHAISFAHDIACDLPNERIGADWIAARFASDYKGSRQRFVQLAQDAGAALTSYPVGGRSPGGEALTIDIAELSGQLPLSRAHAVLVVISGVHGSEGRVGSAIQQELLAARPQLPEGCALMLVHALNPFGMANERRSNAQNVDLNRNFTSSYSGVPEGYEELRGLLSPASAKELEASLERFEHMSTEERHALQKALAPGQYEYPGDPFYGGRERSENLNHLTRHLAARIGETARLLFIDIHTGLGKGGEDTLFFLGENAELFAKLRASLAPRHTIRDPHATIPFFNRVHGSIAGGLAKEFGAHEAASCVQEIGTYPEQLLSTLAVENYCAQAKESSLADVSRELSREFFCPANETWRRGVLQRGTDLAVRAGDALFGSK